MQIHTSTIVLTLLAAFAWIILAYDGYATRKGWPVGEMFSEDASLIKVASLIGLPGSAVAAAYLATWLSAVIVLVVGFFLALLLTKVFRSIVQPISIIGLGLCWFVAIIMLSQA